VPPLCAGAGLMLIMTWGCADQALCGLKVDRGITDDSGGPASLFRPFRWGLITQALR
jgi:hypothetical protein